MMITVIKLHYIYSLNGFKWCGSDIDVHESFAAGGLNG